MWVCENERTDESVSKLSFSVRSVYSGDSDRGSSRSIPIPPSSEYLFGTPRGKYATFKVYFRIFKTSSQITEYSLKQNIYIVSIIYCHYAQFLYIHRFGLLYVSLITMFKKKPGWTSDEGQTLEYLLNVPETPFWVSGPYPSEHVVPDDNRFLFNFGFVLEFMLGVYLSECNELSFSPMNSPYGF